MIQFRLVGICLCVRLCDTFRHHLRIALFMTGVLAVGALHPCGVFQKFTAKRATHNVVELLLDKLVTILFDHLFFALANGTLSAKPSIEWLLVPRVLHWALLACCQVAQGDGSY